MVFDKFSKTLLTLGYKSSVNHTLFVRRKNGTTAIVVYCDDIIVTLTGDNAEKKYL